ncbi:MAG: SDR family oxidoreductase [Opitutaceae bacterium]
MRILLLGGSGLVGSNLAPLAHKRGHQTIAWSGSWPGEIPGAERTVRIDLTDLDAVQSAILDLFPDAIINAAGVTEPAHCQQDPRGSALLNVELPERLARLAHHLSARFIHFSSEQVFDGSRPPYRAADKPDPTNLYGRQKAESEKRVLDAAPETAIVLRVPLLTGNSLRGTRSLHERLFGLWSRNQAARLYHDEIRQPCSADNLAALAVELCERNDLQGIQHWAGAEPLSRFEMGRRILQRFGLPEDLVIRSSRLDDPESTHRPADLSMDLTGLAGIVKTPRQDFADQLDRMIVPIPFREWFNTLG